MKLFFIQLPSLTIMWLLSSLSFAAGNGTSGGGASVVCRDQSGKIISAQLYDLYEAQNNSTHPVEILRNKEAPQKQINEALQRWLERGASNSSWENTTEIDVATLRRTLGLVKRDWSPLRAGTRLPYTPDVNPSFLPKDSRCSLETTANYSDAKNTLLVDMEIFSLLSPTDQAALLVHEAAYKVNRIFSHEVSSENTRRMVARLFSKEKHNIKFQKSLGSIGIIDNAIKLNAAIVDIIFGGKTLNCKESGEATPSLFLKAKKVKESDSTDEDSRAPFNSEEDELYISMADSSGPLGDEVSLLIQREFLPKKTFGDDYFSFGVINGSDGIAIEVPLHDLIKDETYVREIPMTNALYSSSPERGDEIKNAPRSCSLQ